MAKAVQPQKIRFSQAIQGLEVTMRASSSRLTTFASLCPQ